MDKKRSDKHKIISSIKSLYWLWFLIIFILLIAVIAFIVVFLLLKDTYQKSQQSCSEQFDIFDNLEFDNFDEKQNKFCLRATQYQNQKICFTVDTKNKNNVTIQFGNITTKNFGAFEDLPKSENDSSNITIVGISLIVFQYPFSDNTIAIRNLSNKNDAGRLCYNFDKHFAFVSGPTDSFISASHH